jgi:hypothetical protein
VAWHNVWAAPKQAAWKKARDTNHLFLSEGLWSACGSVEESEVQGESEPNIPTCAECKEIQDGGTDSQEAA